MLNNLNKLFNKPVDGMVVQQVVCVPHCSSIPMSVSACLCEVFMFSLCMPGFSFGTLEAADQKHAHKVSWCLRYECEHKDCL